MDEWLTTAVTSDLQLNQGQPPRSPWRADYLGGGRWSVGFDFSAPAGPQLWDVFEDILGGVPLDATTRAVEDAQIDSDFF